MSYSKAKKLLKSFASEERRQSNMRFFKTGKGQYGEGDKFIGVTMPDTRKVVKKYWDISSSETLKFVKSPIHEERMLGLLILVEKHKRGDETTRKKVYEIYIKHFKYINNWDLVDVTAPYIIGMELKNKNNSQLTKWAKSKDLWTRRIAIIGTFYLTRQGELEEVYRISKILLKDDHDLIHKAVGWMLREAGKKDQKRLEQFLLVHGPKMPRTMLRYAIEKFEEKKRKQFLSL